MRKKWLSKIIDSDVLPIVFVSVLLSSMTMMAPETSFPQLIFTAICMGGLVGIFLYRIKRLEAHIRKLEDEKKSSPGDKIN